MESAKAEENSQHAWVMRILKVLCEFRITPCGMRNFRMTWSSFLPKAISSSFQLQIVHGLKRWIFDFQSFEMEHVKNGLREVLQKCERRLQLLSFDFFTLLHVASLLCLTCLNDPKSCQNIKTSHKYD